MEKLGENIRFMIGNITLIDINTNTHASVYS